MRASEPAGEILRGAKDLGRQLFEVKNGGGGGSRTRVRNPCQQRDSMRSRVPENSHDALRTDKMRVTLVR